MTASLPSADQRRCCPRIRRLREGIDPAARRQVAVVLGNGGPWPLVLTGPVGTGKTCLALCVADWWQQHRSPDAWYYTASELAAMVADARCGRLFYERGSRRSERDLFDDLDRHGLVVLDELGLRSKPAETEYDAVKRLLDAREGRPLVVVANLTVGELARVYDDRVASRLCLGRILELSGPDRRLLANPGDRAQPAQERERPPLASVAGRDGP